MSRPSIVEPTFTELPTGDLRCNETGNVIAPEERGQFLTSYIAKRVAHSRVAPTLRPDEQLAAAQAAATDAASIARRAIAENNELRAQLAAASKAG